MRHLICAILSAAALTAAGCGQNTEYVTPERLDNGLVVILPGIEGESSFNHDIRKGLLEAGVDRALPIHRWGNPIPVAGALLNQMNVIGNRFAARQIAEAIVAYQDEYPGRPVHIVGHSGGGGVAVFAAEALPPGRKIDGLILLSASISSGYDLQDALAHCCNGVVSFRSERDGLLVIGTTLAGNVDGMHGPAAGAIGFDRPRATSRPERCAAYAKLYEVRLTDELIGGADAHTAATRADFVLEHVAPWVQSPRWPAPADDRPATPAGPNSVASSR